MAKLLLVIALQTALAAAPLLTSLHPRGAQQGKTFTLTLDGADLPPGSTLITTLPATFTPLTPTGKGLPFLVELKPGVPIGIYPIRARTADGISNILFLTIGALPEIEEEETMGHTNDSFATAQIIKSLPITVNGTLTGADRDIYSIKAKAGEHRTFEVEARRCGSAIDPVLELYDDNGQKLARNEDAPGIGVDSRLDFTFPHEGNYFIEVHDARYSKQAQNFYRLLIGTYSYAESVFPLGGRRGESLNLQFATKNGPFSSTIQLPKQGDFAIAALPNSPTLPFRIALSDYPEIIEPTAPLPIPVVVNGRIAKPAAVNRYQLNVTPGEPLLFELQCRELGASRLDGLVTIYDSAGKKLASAGDAPPAVDVFSISAVGRTSPDPTLNFKVPDSVKEITVAVEDIAQRGGSDFDYRLTIRKLAEDFRMSVAPAYVNIPRGGTMQISVNADRRGFDGPIHAAIPNLPKGWIADGGYIAEETIDPSNQRSFSRRGVMTLTVATDAEWPASDLQIVGEAQLADGSTLRKSATGPGAVIDVAGGTGLPDASSTDRQKPVTAPWLGLALPAAITKESSAILEVKSAGQKEMAEGNAYSFEWKFTAKRKGQALPTSVNADVPGLRDIRVIDMKVSPKDSATGTFTITTTRATTPAIYDLAISATLMVDGLRETVYARAIPFEVKEASTDNATKSTPGGR